MLQRITVDLRGGSEQEASTVAPGDLEHVARACGTGFEGLDRVRQIILRARERREVPDAVKPAIHPNRRGDIAFEEAEPGMSLQMIDVPPAPSDQIIEGSDSVALRKEAVAKMRADEPCGA